MSTLRDPERHPRCVRWQMSRTLPDDELMSRVEDVLKANFSAARAEVGTADENQEPQHFTLPANQEGYEIPPRT